MRVNIPAPWILWVDIHLRLRMYISYLHIYDRILTPLESKGQEHFRGDWSTRWGGARQPRPGAKVTSNWALNKGPSPRNPKNAWTLQWFRVNEPVWRLGVFLGPQNSPFWGVRILRAVCLCQQNIWGYTTATTTTQVFLGIVSLTEGEGFLPAKQLVPSISSVFL